MNTGQQYEWTREKFIDRLFLMKEMYHNYETAEEEWDLPFVCSNWFNISIILYFVFYTRIKIHLLKTYNESV